MPELDVDSLSSALQGDLPCGADLEYDPAFRALEEAGKVNAEQQYGDTIIPAEERDWPVIHQHARQLAERTRDLRVAVWLVRSGAHTGGLAAAVDGLRLVHQLVERQWEHVHPQLDASEDNDPTARLNALAPLSALDAGVADLRAAGLSTARGSLTVRGLELALGRADPLPGEAVPTEEGVLDAVRTALARQATLAAAMQAGHDAVQGIVQAIELRLGAAQGPDLVPLKKLMQRVADAARRAQGAAAIQSGEGAGGANGANSAAAPGNIHSAAPGTINSREDVARTLERVCEWIERNEPSNPAPLLIRRAQRLMSKSFIDIVRDLAPDGLGQVEKLAGLGSE